MPVISIILPTYNRAHLIRRTLESVLEQSFEDFEVIISDDGSTDNTEEIIGSFNDSRIVYIKSIENRGVSAARNTAINAAKGNYIAFIDSDDIWLKDKLQKQMDAFKTAPANTGVVYSCVRQLNGTQEKHVPSGKNNPKEGNIHNALLSGSFLYPSSVMVKKECFETAGMFNEQLKSHEDWELFLRICKLYEVKFIDEILVVKYIQNDNLSVNLDLSIKGLKLLLKLHSEDYAANKKILSGKYFYMATLLMKNRSFFKSAYYQLKSILTYPPNGIRRIIGNDTYNRSVRLLKKLKKLFRGR